MSYQRRGASVLAILGATHCSHNLENVNHSFCIWAELPLYSIFFYYLVINSLFSYYERSHRHIFPTFLESYIYPVFSPDPLMKAVFGKLFNLNPPPLVLESFRIIDSSGGQGESSSALANIALWSSLSSAKR